MALSRQQGSLRSSRRGPLGGGGGALKKMGGEERKRPSFYHPLVLDLAVVLGEKKMIYAPHIYYRREAHAREAQRKKNQSVPGSRYHSGVSNPY